MSVYKPKGKPHYHYDFQVRGVRYHGSTGVASKRDAEKFERDRRSAVALGVREKPSLTLDEATGIYWQDRGLFESASKTTEYQLANLNRLLGDGIILHDLDDLSISRMVARRRGEKARNRGDNLISSATVNREVEVLRRVCNHVKSRYRVPEIEWSKHWLREPRERVRHASADEESRLFKALDAEDHDLADLVEFSLLSGARKNAVVTLLWSKVDLGKQSAEVRTKGGVWHRFPLTTRLIEIIANRPKVGPFVFTYVCRKTRKAITDKMGRKHPARRKGDRYPFSKQGWDKRWRAMLEQAGVENFRFHDLRHTAGTRISKEAGIKAAMNLLGHTRVETTARYVHVEEADLRQAMENVEQSRHSPDRTNADDAESGGISKARA